MLKYSSQATFLLFCALLFRHCAVLTLSCFVVGCFDACSLDRTVLLQAVVMHALLVMLVCHVLLNDAYMGYLSHHNADVSVQYQKDVGSAMPISLLKGRKLLLLYSKLCEAPVNSKKPRFPVVAREEHSTCHWSLNPEYYGFRVHNCFHLWSKKVDTKASSCTSANQA